MAFQRVQKAMNRGPRLEDEEVRMGCHPPTSTVPLQSIYFSISRVLINKLGLKPEYTKNGRAVVPFDIHEGTGEDAGFLMLVPDKRGYAFGASKSTQHASTANLSVSCNIMASALTNYKVNTSESVPAAPIDHSIDGQSILIQVPSWLEYVGPVKQKKEETSPPNPTKPTVIARVRPNDVAVEVEREDNVAPLTRNERRQIAKKIARSI